jgi:signal transduction histidine kinase
MKLGLKIILPLLLLIVIIGGSLAYLLYSLTLDGQNLASTTNQIQKLNGLVEELNRQQYITEFNVLSYRFQQKKAYLDAISETDLEVARTLDDASSLVVQPKGRELIKTFIDAKRNVAKTRSELIIAIQDKREEDIALNFNRWSLQIQNIRAALADVNAFNINSIEGTVVSANQVRNTVAQTVIGMIFILLFAILLLYWFFTTWVVRPIRALAKATEEISRSDSTTLSTTTISETHSNDEIGQLTFSFAKMVGRLKESHADLEAKIKDRTRELEEAKAQIEVVFATMPVGIFLAKAPNGEPLMINEKGTFLLGRTVQASLDKEAYQEFYNITRPDGTPYPNEELPISLALREERIIEGDDIILNHPDGTHVQVHVIAAPIKDSSGKVFAAIAVFEDITHEKQIDKAKTEFVSLASHQLRTPVTAVNWNAELLLDPKAPKLDPEQRQHVESIYRSNQRMTELVDSLLNVSRLELGTFSVEPVMLNVVDVCKSILEEVKPLIVKKALIIVEKYDKNIPLISADKKLTTILFQNLISNACKYSHQGKKVYVTISKKGDMLVVKVKDTGIGIPAGQQSKIFSKLFRADNATQQETDGTGLGLYIIKSILEHVGGTVSFESVENKGSTFQFNLPLAGMENKQGNRSLQ